MNFFHLSFSTYIVIYCIVAAVVITIIYLMCVKAPFYCLFCGKFIKGKEEDHMCKEKRYYAQIK